MRNLLQAAVIQELNDLGRPDLALEAETKWGFGAPFNSDGFLGVPMETQLKIDQVNKEVLVAYNIMSGVMDDLQLALPLSPA